MQVRAIDVTDADVRSAKLFFDALAGFYDLSEAHALDMFARNGQLTIRNYVDRLKTVDAWELNGEHREALHDLGAEIVTIGCSYLNAVHAAKRYDLIVIDSPQGAHNDYSGSTRFEHFHSLQSLKKLDKPRCIVVLYVNKEPYDKNKEGDHGYDRYDEYDFEAWMKARQSFYSHSPYKISDAVALHAYEREMGFMGFGVVNTVMLPCYSDVPRRENYAMRVGLEIVLK